MVRDIYSWYVTPHFSCGWKDVENDSMIFLLVKRERTREQGQASEKGKTSEHGRNKACFEHIPLSIDPVEFWRNEQNKLSFDLLTFPYLFTLDLGVFKMTNYF